MGLSGLDIYKLLPKTNCRECGFSTCLAFAMQLAKKAISIEKCRFISEEIKQKLIEATLPPIKLIEIGTGDSKTLIGNETVLFRHEEKFFNPCALGCILDDDLEPKIFEEKLSRIINTQFERVGQVLKLDLIAIRNKSNNPEKFIECLKKVLSHKQNIALITENIQALKLAVELCSNRKPLVYFTKQLTNDAIDILKSVNANLVVKSDTLDNLSSSVSNLSNAGLTNLILEIDTPKTQEKLWNLTQIRRLALKKKNRAFGYPQIAIVKNNSDFLGVMRAATFLAKYASVILLEDFSTEEIFSLLTLRQNIYSDPQKPLQVEPKAYAVGPVTPNSPVLVTTNFSLTYYTVLSEVEASKVPSYIVSIDTEGMSVLTAWAAEKFTAQSVNKGLETCGINDKVKHNRVIIPGYVATMNQDLKNLSKKEVIVGPKEASGIPALLKNQK